MRVDDFNDFGSLLLADGLYPFNITSWVYDHGFAGSLASDYIAEIIHEPDFNLFDEHVYPPLFQNAAKAVPFLPLGYRQLSAACQPSRAPLSIGFDDGGESKTTRKAGGLDVWSQAGKTKTRPCIHLCGFSRVLYARFQNNQSTGVR